MKKIFKLIFVLCCLVFLFSSVAYSEGTHYLERAVNDDGTKHVWKTFPVGVYVQQSPYRNEVINAFVAWQRATNGGIRFGLAKSSSSAQIVVSFSSKLPGGVAGLTGHASTSGQGTKYITHSNIQLVPPSAVNEQTKAFVYTVALHEIGHAVGICGHSSNKSDIMYPSVTSYGTRASLSARDIETIKWLYKVDNNTLKKHEKYLTNSKIAEAEAYVKKFPTATIGWSNLGSAYYENKMYNKAIAAYKKGFSLNNKAYKISYNLAITYMQINDYNNAFYYAYKTYMLNQTVDNLYLLASCMKNGDNRGTLRKCYVYHIKKYPNSLKDPRMPHIRRTAVGR